MATRVDELRNGNTGPAGAYVDLDDRMLVLDFQAGNGNRDPAFAEIHRRYAGLARHVCYRILANASDAEDATQETMLRVLQGLGRFNGRYRLQPWVARIATNVSLDMLRTRARRPQSAEGELSELDRVFDDADDPSVLVDQLIERERIQKVLSELPDHHREALVLREYEGRSHEEIGKALGVTPAQAKALIHRAKGSFRRQWLATSEKRGLAGVALAPLLWLVRLGSGLRRFVDHAAEAGQSAVTQAAQIAVSPAVPASTSQTGERIVAAAVTLLVAGGMTVGAATLSHHSAPARLQAPPSASAIAPPPPASVGPVRVAPSKPVRVKAVVVKPHPTPVSETSPTPPTPPPVGDGVTPPPPVVVPEPPGFAVSGSSDFETTVRCECGTAPTTVDQIDGKPDGIASFTEVVTDAALADATGETAWGLWLQQSSPDGVSHQMIFDLYTPAGPERYLANGAVVSVKQTDWGGWIYVFEGEYGFSAGPPEGLDLVPTDGTYRMTVTLSVASGRVISNALQLTQDVVPTTEVTPPPDVSPSPDADVPQDGASPVS